MEDFLMCAKCHVITAVNIDPSKDDHELIFCKCVDDDGFSVSGSDLKPFFPDYIPTSPRLGAFIELPPINFFEAREIVNILAHGDAADR